MKGTGISFMNKQIVLICFAILLVAIPLVNHAQNLFDRDHSSAYAGYLEKSGQYSLAADEYERLVFMSPGIDSLKVSLLRNYRKSGAFAKGIHRADAFYSAPGAFAPGPAIEYSKLLFLNQDYTGLLNYSNHTAFPLTEAYRSYFRVNALMMTRQWKTALVEWQQNAESMSFLAPALRSEYDQVILDAQDLKHRSPGLAMAMSAVIPGSGKAWTGQWGDAAYSLLFTVGPAIASWRFFNRYGKENFFAWGFAGLATAFYAANVYGGYRSAAHFNERQAEKIILKIQGLAITAF